MTAPVNRLKELRERSRLTQEEVAKLLDIHFTTVSKHESGARTLTEKDICAYSRLYKVSSYELFISPEQLGPECGVNEHK